MMCPSKIGGVSSEGTKHFTSCAYWCGTSQLQELSNESLWCCWFSGMGRSKDEPFFKWSYYHLHTCYLL